MKKCAVKKILAFTITAVLLLSNAVLPASAATPAEKKYMNVGYAFRRGLVVEDLALSKITHLNYSFGLIYNRETPPNTTEELNPDCQTPTEFDDALLNTIYLPDDAKSDLKKLIPLKALKNPDLKVMLSVGGWNARGFSDAAATEEGRKAFAKSCKAMINEYKLDGIDLDWEYPTIDWGNIKVRKEDPHNFTLLLQEVRNEIGKDKLLSIAGSSNVNFTKDWVEFDKVISILDYINIMTYDFQYGTCYYGSALYASKKWPTSDPADEYNADMAIKLYIAKGCPAAKINMGLSYSAIPLPEAIIKTDADKANWKIVEQNLKDCGYTDSTQPDLKKVATFLENKQYTRANGSKYKFDKKWDPNACISYIATYDKAGKELFVLSYIDAKGLTAKTDYVKKNGLGGTMFWQFGDDYDNLLTSQIANEFKIKSAALPSSTKNPKTGSSVFPVAITSILALVSLSFIFVSKKRREAE